MTKLRAHMIVTGRVQGVGFRFSTKQIADKIGVGGWVKNLPDQTVEIEAEGDVEKVYQFIDEIKANPSYAGQVSHVDLNVYENLKNYQSFNTKH